MKNQTKAAEKANGRKPKKQIKTTASKKSHKKTEGGQEWAESVFAECKDYIEAEKAAREYLKARGAKIAFVQIHNKEPGENWYLKSEYTITAKPRKGDGTIEGEILEIEAFAKNYEKKQKSREQRRRQARKIYEA